MAALCPYYWFMPKKEAETTQSTVTVDDTALLTEKMKVATSKIHTLSDVAVNAKLVFAFADRRVWGHCLACFYHIWSALEHALEDHKDAPVLKSLNDIQDQVSRRLQFEKDLKFFLGETEWKPVVANELTGASASAVQVREYVHHLKHARPLLLIAYFYHLNMALLAGGQMIKRLAKRGMNLPKGRGVALFEYGNGTNRRSIKSALRTAMNEIELSKTDNAHLLAESVAVFERNNRLVASIEVRRGVCILVLNIIRSKYVFAPLLLGVIATYMWV